MLGVCMRDATRDQSSSGSGGGGAGSRSNPSIAGGGASTRSLGGGESPRSRRCAPVRFARLLAPFCPRFGHDETIAPGSAADEGVPFGVAERIRVEASRLPRGEELLGGAAHEAERGLDDRGPSAEPPDPQPVERGRVGEAR